MSSKTDLQNEIEKIGLNEYESRVYLACLENPKMTPSKLSTITNIKRTSLYPILQGLLDKNFIYQKVYLKKKYIFAHSPKHAMEGVARQAKKHADNVAISAEKLIKKLEHRVGQKTYGVSSEATFFSGRPGVRELVQKVLDEKKDIYWLGQSKIFLDLNKDQQRELFQRLSVKRMDDGTTAYAMTDKAFETSFYFHGGSAKFRQLRTLDLPKSLNAMIVVTGDLCGFVKSFDNKSQSVIFRDADYANILRFTLQLIWETLEVKTKIPH